MKELTIEPAPDRKVCFISMSYGYDEKMALDVSDVENLTEFRHFSYPIGSEYSFYNSLFVIYQGTRL